MHQDNLVIILEGRAIALVSPMNFYCFHKVSLLSKLPLLLHLAAKRCQALLYL